MLTFGLENGKISHRTKGIKRLQRSPKYSRLNACQIFINLLFFTQLVDVLEILIIFINPNLHPLVDILYKCSSTHRQYLGIGIGLGLGIGLRLLLCQG